jgi:Phosphotransferase enzyme family
VGGDVTDGIVRIGDTVRRPRGPWSDSVASYLLHLEHAGFDASPRFLGVDEQGRDTLEFVPGEVPSQPVVEAWAATASVLSAIAILLKRLHLASASFLAPADACWFGDDLTVELPVKLPPAPQPEIVSHFDVTPQNVVFRSGEPVALIDFDLTRPGTRLQDVINTAMWWVPLFPPEDRDPAMTLGDVPSRLAMFVDSYGLGATERTAFVDLAVEGATRAWYRMRANAEHRGGGWARMWNEGVGDRILRRRAWLLANQAILDRALR